jgi:hypothetical protein
MKRWQVEAIKKIDRAAALAKEDILTTGPKVNYDYVTGEIDVNLVEQHDDNWTLTRKRKYPL